MWLETSTLTMVNLEHYSTIQVVPGGSKVAVRAYHGMRQDMTPLAEFDTLEKAESYFHELRLFMAKGRRVIHHKEFSRV
jgi:hypothetical protein